MYKYLPKIYSDSSIGLYAGVLILCNALFFSHILSVAWWLFGLVEVIAFFYFANQLTRQWGRLSLKRFPKKLFATALIIRIVWVIFSYFFYSWMTGKPFEFSPGDAMFYHNTASELAQVGYAHINGVFGGTDISDMGYATYLGSVYMIFGNGVIIPRLIKAVLGSLTAVLVYRLATRNFDEPTGRMAGIFCMLMPNLILYTGMHLKEVEMVFLAMAFLERADFLIRSKQFNMLNIATPLLLAGLMFFIRTVLGVTALFALITTLLLTPNNILGMGRRMVIITWAAITIGYFVGGRIAVQVEEMWQSRTQTQETSLQWRSERVNGNVFAKKVGAAVFAPLIFTIPFPTLVETPQQENQKLINGGNFVKNILSFFVILAVFIIIKENRWRDYLLIGSFTIGYMIILAFSAFAQSERFHQPVIPMEMIFAAYGLSLMNKKRQRLFNWWQVFLFGAILFWSWFKLAGRGMA